MVDNKLCFVLLTLFSLQLPANTDTAEVVRFYPPLFLKNSHECVGVRDSHDSIAITKECAIAARNNEGENRLIIGLDKQKKGILDISHKQAKDSESEYLENAFLISGENDKEIKSPFKSSDFKLGVNYGYTLLHNADNEEVVKVEVILDTFEYPYAVNHFQTERRLPSGSPVFDENGRLQCLLASDRTCLTFNSKLTSLIKQMQTRASSGTPLLAPDGDCCHPATHEFYLECITYCAMHPCNLCPSCKKTEGKTELSGEELGQIALVAATVSTTLFAVSFVLYALYSQPRGVYFPSKGL